MEIFKIITLIASLGTILAVGIAIVTVMQAQESIESTNNLIKNTNGTLTSLNTLIDSNTKQLKILEESLLEVKNLSIINAYSSLESIKLTFSCADMQNGKIYFVPRIWDGCKNMQTVVPIQLFLHFNIYEQTKNIVGNAPVEELETIHITYNPLETSADFEMPMSTFYEKPQEEGLNQVQIYSDFAYAPFFPNNEKHIPFLDIMETPELVFELHRVNGIWALEPESSPCLKGYD